SMDRDCTAAHGPVPVESRVADRDGAGPHFDSAPVKRSDVAAEDAIAHRQVRAPEGHAALPVPADGATAHCQFAKNAQAGTGVVPNDTVRDRATAPLVEHGFLERPGPVRDEA